MLFVVRFKSEGAFSNFAKIFLNSISTLILTSSGLFNFSLRDPGRLIVVLMGYMQQPHLIMMLHYFYHGQVMGIYRAGRRILIMLFNDSNSTTGLLILTESIHQSMENTSKSLKLMLYKNMNSKNKLSS